MKKTAFLTGGSGFVGFNIAGQLVDKGWNVVALHRRTSDITYLKRLNVETVTGDIREPDSLIQAMPEKVDAVFHVAADLSTWSRRNAAQTAVNVDGTKNMVAAALQRQAGRFILTSTISAFGHHRTPVTETTPSNAAYSWINYERSKWEAEEAVRYGGRQGLYSVIINPCAIFGPGDTHSWARMIYMIRDGRLKGIPPGSVTVNHVHQVARQQARPARMRGKR